MSLKFQTDLYAVKGSAGRRLTLRVSDSDDISDLNDVQYHRLNVSPREHPLPPRLRDILPRAGGVSLRAGFIQPV